MSTLDGDEGLSNCFGVISERGSASGQGLYQSMAVRQYRKTEETDSGIN